MTVPILFLEYKLIQKFPSLDTTFALLENERSPIIRFVFLLITSKTGSVLILIPRSLKISEIPLIAISKGPDRRAGEEKFYLKNKPPMKLSKTDPLMFFLQRLRDEAHRFAISSHRNLRSRTLVKSELDLIPGIGAKRKKTLLHTFGSKRGIIDAGMNDLSNVKGISKSLASDIYKFFH